MAYYDDALFREKNEVLDEMFEDEEDETLGDEEDGSPMDTEEDDDE